MLNSCRNLHKKTVKSCALHNFSLNVRFTTFGQFFFTNFCNCLALFAASQFYSTSPETRRAKKEVFKTTAGWHQRLATCSSKCELFSKCDTLPVESPRKSQKVPIRKSPESACWNLPRKWESVSHDHLHRVAVGRHEADGLGMNSRCLWIME